MTEFSVGSSALVFGLGAAGASLARALSSRGVELLLADDSANDSHQALADELNAPLAISPNEAVLRNMANQVEMVCPSPGVPLMSHPVYVAAQATNRPVVGELDLAAAWDSRPIVAVTGTDGKTTVTTLVSMMINADGRRCMPVGNTDTPLVDALATNLDVFAVEASSFRLRFCTVFAPQSAVFVNFAPDHLNWHPSLDDYRDAKARIWTAQSSDSIAIGNAADPVVMRCLERATGRHQSFGAGGEFVVRDAVLWAHGERVLAVADMPRSFPHDVDNALAACGAVLGIGVGLDSVRKVLSEFSGLEHRMALVGTVDAVRYYDDSKATSPHAVLTALRSFDDVVLIAGGRNKGLDLTELSLEHQRVRGVVAIGDAAGEVVSAFAGLAPTVVAHSMSEAVHCAHMFAKVGGQRLPVLLSPACTSYDWYANYHERGNDFIACVRALAYEKGMGAE